MRPTLSILDAHGREARLPPPTPPMRASGWIWIVLVAAALAAALLSLVRYTPEVWPGGPYPLVGTSVAWLPVARVPSQLAQLRDPVHWDRAFEYRQGNSLRWRLLLPVVGHDLRLTPTQYFLLPWVGAFWLLALSGWYAYRASSSLPRAAAAVALTATFSTWFTATGWIGYMDPFYVGALLVVAFSPSQIALWGACLLAPWVDERFLLILPACWLLRVSRRGDVSRGAWLPMLGIAPYCLARLAALANGDYSVGAHVALQSESFNTYVAGVPLGWWHGFRAGWIPIAIALAAAWRALPGWRRPGLLLALGAGLGAVVCAAADTSRSIAVLLPFAVLGAALARPPWLVWVLAAANFLLPAAHVSGCGMANKPKVAVVPITCGLLR